MAENCEEMESTLSALDDEILRKNSGKAYNTIGFFPSYASSCTIEKTHEM